MFIYELLLSIVYKLMLFIPTAVHVHHVRVHVLMFKLCCSCTSTMNMSMYMKIHMNSYMNMNMFANIIEIAVSLLNLAFEKINRFSAEKVRILFV
jgi:hypothetical protein